MSEWFHILKLQHVKICQRMWPTYIADDEKKRIYKLCGRYAMFHASGGAKGGQPGHVSRL